MADRTGWVGRVRVPGEPRERVVRLWTDGAAPGPRTEVEEIEDPFAAAIPWKGGDSRANAQTLALTAPAIAGGLRGPLEQYTLAPPVRPGKIICVGRNYRAHAEEMGNDVPEEPILFFKPSTALLGSGQPLSLPRGYQRIDMESELVAVIGRQACQVARDEALQYVAGYTLGNDVSNRDLQRGDKLWTRGKGFDGFAPCGPFVRLWPLSTPLPDDARIRGFLDDEPRQDSALGLMIFDLAFVLSYVSRVMTLEPGDLVYTGTPEGVSALEPGQVVRIELQGVDLGSLVTPLV
ncbi:fumarylacetoacetate hydrolase family protein [Paraliomyxa miuraensis]|uniref:fumarylacetoacetate hydrolase family protein n=1 Tax=Paraliomyxa miuraensis TaxID=376150 RepID=UPI002259B102|nr:fumarylacetoacetate hydrolase family protein [Paraliomyxa miuraensis]MCX4246569.1 fumarylacetoacetate hydrolase family protein [Paraliomyxa miuraensis]